MAEKLKAFRGETGERKLKEEAKKLEKGIEETLTHMAFPYEH